MAGPIFSQIRNPYLTFRSSRFSRTALSRAGATTWGIPRSRVFAPVQIAGFSSGGNSFGSQGGNTGTPSLGLSIAGPPSYDRYRQRLCCSLYQQTRWDPFPHPVKAGSGSVSVATDSGFSHLGQTHSGLLNVKPAHHDRVASPPRNSEPDIRDLGNPSSGHVCHSP